MKYIVDAQLPYLLADILRQRGYDAIHTDDLPDRERTGDQYIRRIASDEGRIVVTKDSDFQDSYLLSKQPPRLLLLTTSKIVSYSICSVRIWMPFMICSSAMHISS